MSALLIPAGTIPGRTIPIGGSCHHGLAAGLANMSSGSTVIVCRPADLTTGDAYIWSRAEAGQVYHSFRFTGTQVRHFIGRGTTNFNFLVDYAALPGLAVGEWIALAHTWDISGATADQRLYIGRPHAPLIEATAYATVTLGAGTLTDDSALNFRTWARGGSSNGLVGEGHGSWIKKGVLLPREELQAIADAMWRGLPLDLLAPTASWYTGANEDGPVMDYGVNGYTGTLATTTAGSAPPLAPLRRRRSWKLASGPTIIESDTAIAGAAAATEVSGATKGAAGSAAGVAAAVEVGAGVVAASATIAGSSSPSVIGASTNGAVESSAGAASTSEVGATVWAGVVNAAGSALVECEGVDAAAATTTIRPTSDVTDGGWLNEAASNTNLYASVDDSPTNDATYVISPRTPAPDALTLGFADPGGTPPAGPMTLTIRMRKVTPE